MSVAEPAANLKELLGDRIDTARASADAALKLANAHEVAIGKLEERIENQIGELTRRIAELEKSRETAGNRVWQVAFLLASAAAGAVGSAAVGVVLYLLKVK